MNTRLIKRYPNRKFYDSVESRYITSPEVLALFQELKGNLKVVAVHALKAESSYRDVTQEVVTNAALRAMAKDETYRKSLFESIARGRQEVA